MLFFYYLELGTVTYHAEGQLLLGEQMNKSCVCLVHAFVDILSISLN